MSPLGQNIQQEEKHSYIIVRTNLSPSQITVQSCHAVWEAAKNERYGSPSLVILGVENEFALNKAMKLLLINNIKFYIFRESYYNNSITAICTEPIKGEARKVLSNYQLL